LLEAAQVVPLRKNPAAPSQKAQALLELQARQPTVHWAFIVRAKARRVNNLSMV
jgi:hypothetical protein